MKKKVFFGLKNRFKTRAGAGFKLLLMIACVLSYQVISAQNPLILADLTFFQDPGPSWQLAGDVHGDLTQKSVLTTSPGTGVLVNLPGENTPGRDLLSQTQYGDMDLELDFMMATGSNSGIYLQGRYEVQLLDSWAKLNPTAGDNGGIYERWDENKPEGQQGYDGHAPRQNASRAPGLWQHLKISFRAPRFNQEGKKIEDAKILRVELNKVVIHELVVLSGPTRGALENNEVAKGPLRLQGDHGAVAFRNIKVTPYDKPLPEFLDLKYFIYKGNFNNSDPDFDKLQPETKGESPILSSAVSTSSNEFLIRYTGTILIKEPGLYHFRLSTPGGKGTIKIKNQEVIPMGQSRGSRGGSVTLVAGEYPFEVSYAKFLAVANPSLGLSVAGPGIREFVIGDATIANSDPVDPILIHAPVNTIMRSFVDLDTIRVTHAVNVGSAQQVHYTYDMDHGMLVQLWRGGFLDATPMWHSRGDGSSRATGMVQQFGKPMPAIEMLSTPGVAWSADTTGTGFRSKGYVIDASDRPTFRYMVYNTMVNDQIRVLPDGQGIDREVSLQNPVANLYLKLAAANKIEKVSERLYLLNDKSYYLRIDDAGNEQPQIRDTNGGKELIIPVKNKVSYSILF